MGQNRQEESVVRLSLLLLLGCILVGSGFTLPYPQTTHISYDSHEDTWTCVLSNETPAARFYPGPDAISVEIIGLSANDSVNLLVFVDYAVALNCTNVTSMFQVTSKIAAQGTPFWASTNMWMQVRRAGRDAWMYTELRTVTQSILLVDYSMITYTAPYGLVVTGAFVALYSLRHLASMQRRDLKRTQSREQVPYRRSRITPAMIAFLIVLGGLLCMPFARGVLLDEYAIVTGEKSVSSGETTFRLSESLPSSGFELANLCPSAEVNYTIEIQVTVSGEFPVIISVDGAQGHEEFTLENCTDSDRWLLKFEARADEPKQVWFEKISGIADIDCQYVVKANVTGPQTNPIPALLMGSAGGVLFLWGLISARRRNQLLQTAEPQQTTDVLS